MAKNEKSSTMTTLYCEATDIVAAPLLGHSGIAGSEAGQAPATVMARKKRWLPV